MRGTTKLRYYLHFSGSGGYVFNNTQTRSSGHYSCSHEHKEDPQHGSIGIVRMKLHRKAAATAVPAIKYTVYSAFFYIPAKRWSHLLFHDFTSMTMAWSGITHCSRGFSVIRQRRNPSRSNNKAFVALPVIKFTSARLRFIAIFHRWIFSILSSCVIKEMFIQQTACYDQPLSLIKNYYQLFRIHDSRKLVEHLTKQYIINNYKMNIF